ncbi:hypothetical protein G5I_03255 [Acromyrmex echinatior]|uniref:Uncharacterized protein n=1 Tax=Acromyrmex echinatior TaxID=103372 RepID=F4WCH9_ACREC|nr:hypothetical protein G5I_03255 [Acromyrmex echinatior]
MASYFGWMAFDLREIFYPILITNYVKSKTMTIVLHTLCLINNIFKFLLINYICEKVTTKAKVTADILNRLSYVTCDIEVREIFVTSVATVVIIILQAQGKAGVVAYRGKLVKCKYRNMASQAIKS